MRRGNRALAAAFVAISAAAVGALASPAFAGDPFNPSPIVPPSSDSLKSPMQTQQAALVAKGKAMQLDGTIAPNAKIGKVAKGQYVQLAQTGHSNVFVILAQFGEQINPALGGTPGPTIGQIAAPDRTQDNSTIYFDDNSPDHYRQLYFDHTPGANSLTNFYQSESSGQFSFDGDVNGWVTVPFNEARYGTDLCGSTVCTTVWSLLRDAAAVWVKQKIEQDGWTMERVQSYLANFDQEDRYDYNGNGNFNEPDGYVDHFQLIHAGEGEEVGGGAQGADAIWSHRWYSFQGGIGSQGPANGNLLGGFQIGVAPGIGINYPTGYWSGDYVMEPENAGTGVIAHETGHDYGLPDEYDTSYAGEAPSTWWTLMSQGSYGNDGTNGIGNKPVDFDAWDKFQLGWLNYQVARPFSKGLQAFRLGPAETNTRQAQGVFVILPQKDVSTHVGTPTGGAKAAYSGSGDSYDATASRSVAVPAGATQLSMDAWYDMEQDWDYAFLQVSTNNGTSWTNLPTSQSDAAANDQSGFNADGTGISGTSGHPGLADWYNGRPAPDWVQVTANIASYAGQTVLFRVEYKTDGASHGLGFEFDNLTAGSFNDGLEEATPWTFTSGFHLTTGTDTTKAANYYVVENRQYLNYDNGLRFPYYFSDPTRPNWVEHYPFQDGVLVSYWDTSQGDNNTGEHPGDGLILPIDVHNNVIMRSDGVAARTRVQAYDATLSTQPTDALHLDGYTADHTYTIDQPSQPGIRTFDDRNDYTNAGVVSAGVATPHFGTIITLQSMDAAGFANVTIAPAK